MTGCGNKAMKANKVANKSDKGRVFNETISTPDVCPDSENTLITDWYAVGSLNMKPVLANEAKTKGKLEPSEDETSTDIMADILSGNEAEREESKGEPNSGKGEKAATEAKEWVFVVRVKSDEGNVPAIEQAANGVKKRGNWGR